MAVKCFLGTTTYTSTTFLGYPSSSGSKPLFTLCDGAKRIVPKGTAKSSKKQQFNKVFNPSSIFSASGFELCSLIR
jgi:hypothetical protein